MRSYSDTERHCESRGSYLRTQRMARPSLEPRPFEQEFGAPTIGQNAFRKYWKYNVISKIQPSLLT